MSVQMCSEVCYEQHILIDNDLLNHSRSTGADWLIRQSPASSLHFFFFN